MKCLFQSVLDFVRLKKNNERGIKRSLFQSEYLKKIKGDLVS